MTWRYDFPPTDGSTFLLAYRLSEDHLPAYCLATMSECDDENTWLPANASDGEFLEFDQHTLFCWAHLDAPQFADWADFMRDEYKGHDRG